MSKPDRRWPMWKLALAAAGLGAASATLIVLSFVLEEPTRSDGDAAPGPLLSVPTFLLMMGVGIGMLAGLAVGWWIYRIHESRIPVWERKKPRKRRRKF